MRDKSRRLTVKRYALGAQLLGSASHGSYSETHEAYSCTVVATDLLVTPFQILSSGVISNLTLPASSLLFEFYFALCRVAFAAVPMRGDRHRQALTTTTTVKPVKSDLGTHRTGRLVPNPWGYPIWNLQRNHCVRERRAIGYRIDKQLISSGSRCMVLLPSSGWTTVILHDSPLLVLASLHVASLCRTAFAMGSAH